MSTLAFLNFDLRIERTDGRYRARVSYSPAGEATHTFDSPFARDTLDGLLRAAGQTRGLGIVAPDNAPTPADAVRSLGGTLFSSVFQGDVQDALLRSRDAARRENKGLRIRLRLTDVPELAQLPWEYLYDAGRDDFLATSNRTPIVRYMDLPEAVEPLSVAPPLRIVVMIASPSDYPQLDTEQEWRRLTEALSSLTDSGQIAIERLEEATLPALQRKLQTQQYHIFHYIGHGDYDAQSQDGVLLLEDDAGAGVRVESRRLGVLLRDHSSLRLAVLNACRGARSAESDPFAGTAQALVRRRIPAVIAMQFEITDEAAITFAHDFYGALANGYPVDAALAEARKAIYFQGNDVEWGTPVLFMRAPDGRLFNIESEEADTSVPDTTLSTTPAVSPEEADVFVSYSPADERWVQRELVPQLRDAGISVITEQEFPLGEARLISMENAVEQTQHTIIVMSPAWIDDEWSEFETLLTQTSDPAGRRRKLIPLMLKQVTPPLRIRMLNYADFTTPATRRRDLSRLISAVGGDISDTQQAAEQPESHEEPASHETTDTDLAESETSSPDTSAGLSEGSLAQYEREVADIVQKLQQRRLVLFIGGDLSEDLTGAPSRQALARQLAQKEGLDREQRFAQIAQQVMQHGNRWEFTNFLKQNLSPAGAQPGEFYQRLARLIAVAGPDLIITTAYHSMLETAARDTQISVVATDSALPFADPSHTTLLKLYGDVQQVDSLIVTEQDQNALLRSRQKPEIVDEVRRAFRRNSVLFLGYDLQDPAVSALFDEVAGDTFQLRSYAVWRDLSEAEADSFEGNRGLVVLPIDPLALLNTLIEHVAG